MLYSIILLKCIACLLIVNFHSDYIYPEILRKISFGGDIGNNLFFMINGFLIYKGICKCGIKEMPVWIAKKYIRLLPITLIFDLIYFIITYINGNIANVFYCFVLHYAFWFVGALLIFYLFIFPIVKLYNIYIVCGIYIVLLIICFVFDGMIAERYIIGFISLLTGCLLRKNIENISPTKKVKIYFAIMALASFTLFFIFKMIYKMYSRTNVLFHVLVGVSTIVTSLFLILWAYCSEQSIAIFLKKYTKIYSIILFVANLTLEIYLVQILFVNKHVETLVKSNLPIIALPIYFIVILLIAYITYLIDNRIQIRIKEMHLLEK